MSNEGTDVGIRERLLTLREVAESLRLHPRTVRALVRRGYLEGRIIANQWRFAPGSLSSFWESAPRDWDFSGKKDTGIR